MTKILVYTTAACPFCQSAKRLLSAKGAQFEEIRVDLDPSRREEMIARSGLRTVPQIFINDQSIGGFDNLSALDREGKLDELLK